MRSVWSETSFMRDEVVFNFVVSRALTERNLKPNPYLTDTAKHIFTVGRGTSTGFKIANNNNSAPISFLREVFSTVYQLKFDPSFIHAGYLSDIEKTNALYYSLETPSLMTFSPKSRNASNKMKDVREIKDIMKVISKYILENCDEIKIKPIHDLASQVSYDFFHSDEDVLHDLNCSKGLENLDKSINELTKNSKKEFCHTSPFLRGCITIKEK